MSLPSWASCPCVCLSPSFCFRLGECVFGGPRASPQGRITRSSQYLWLGLLLHAVEGLGDPEIYFISSNKSSLSAYYLQFDISPKQQQQKNQQAKIPALAKLTFCPEGFRKQRNPIDKSNDPVWEKIMGTEVQGAHRSQF